MKKISLYIIRGRDQNLVYFGQVLCFKLNIGIFKFGKNTPKAFMDIEIWGVPLLIIPESVKFNVIITNPL